MRTYISDLAKISMNCGLYKEALIHLDTVLTHEWKDWRKVLPTIYEAKCHLGEHEKSIWRGSKSKKAFNSTTHNLISLLKRNVTVQQLGPYADDCDKEIAELIMKLITQCADSTELALNLNQCRVQIIQQHYEGISKLQKLGLVGLSMSRIAKDMQNGQEIFREKQGWRFTNSSTKEDITKHFSLMDELRAQMSSVTNVNSRQKSIELVWFLQSYGLSCDFLGHHDKSVIIYYDAINIMNETFKTQYERYEALGHCYNNLQQSLARAQSLRNNSTELEDIMWKCIYAFVIFWIACGVLITTLSLLAKSDQLIHIIGQMIIFPAIFLLSLHMFRDAAMETFGPYTTPVIFIPQLGTKFEEKKS